MFAYFDKEKLHTLLKDFYDSIGMKISIFDADFNVVTEYPDIHPEYCRRIRSTQAGIEACRKCDKGACLNAKEKGEAIIYTCHAGLTEAVTPIKDGDEIIGYAILAHMMRSEDLSSSIDKGVSLASRFGIDQEEARNLLGKIQPRDTHQITSSVAIMDVIAKYLRLSEMVRFQNDDLSGSVDRFIRSNLDKGIKSEDIMSHFGISRTYLYHLSKEAFGMGIAQYIHSIKMELARKLLLEGNPVGMVSDRCGFQDVSYFTKSFKKKFGVLPSSVR